MGSRVGMTPFPQLYPAAAEGGACGVAMVTIYVIGVDHLPTLQTLSAIISFGESYTFRPFDDSAVPDLTSPGMYWYRNQSAAIFDRDDLQGYEAKQINMNLTLFNLHNVSKDSLTLTPILKYRSRSYASPL